MRTHPFDDPADRWMRSGIAFLWLATGLSLVHPAYRAIGAEYLGRLGLPEWLMFAACSGEIALGFAILRLPMSGVLASLQVGAVLFFTAVLAAVEPALLAHPFGVLSKNLPLVALVLTVWLTEREGWSPRALWILRAGMAAIWVTEGIIPKILFQTDFERQVVAGSGLVPVDPSAFLYFMGACQAASGLAALALEGRLLRFVLWAQVAALLVLPVLVSLGDPLLWVHPFGPLTKNVPILAGTVVVLRRLNPRPSHPGD